jgi:hypothetical protein
MTSEGPGYRKFTKFLANHVLRYQYGYMLTAVVDGNRQSNHIGQHHRTARPGLDRSPVVCTRRLSNLLREVRIDKWAFPN